MVKYAPLKDDTSNKLEFGNEYTLNHQYCGFCRVNILLAQTRKTNWSLSKKVLAGLVLGVVFGLGLHLIYGGGHPILAESISWFNIVGNGYVNFTNGRDAFGLCFDFRCGSEAAQASSLGKITSIPSGLCYLRHSSLR